MGDESKKISNQGMEAFPLPSWLQFNPRNLSGNRQIDESHMEMFRIMQELYKCQFLHDSRGSTDRLLKELEAHLEEHFQQEEIMQRKLGYPEHENHMIEHAGLLIQLRQITEQSRTGLCSFGDLLRLLAKAFVKEHLEITDAQFHDWLAAHPVGQK